MKLQLVWWCLLCSHVCSFSIRHQISPALHGCRVAMATVLLSASLKIGASAPVTIEECNKDSLAVPRAILGLQPETLWRNFYALSKVPRPSKREGPVIDLLKQFAVDLGLEWKKDSIGNLIIYRNGSAGGESAPPMLIQSHVDMVCEKNAEKVHDFFKDPIVLLRTGDWLHANGTTLGADNGIGVAAAMALLELPANAKLPPLECLFTVDEETGLTGASALDASLVLPPLARRSPSRVLRHYYPQPPSPPFQAPAIAQNMRHASAHRGNNTRPPRRKFAHNCPCSTRTHDNTHARMHAYIHERRPPARPHSRPHSRPPARPHTRCERRGRC